MKVGIVLLYGILDPSRRDIERYYTYLNQVARDILENNVEKVILCGGFTNAQKPDLSEAATVGEFLKNKLPEQEIILEERSITTNQNLEFASQLVDSTDNLIVYCDLARKAKVVWIALHFLLGVGPREIYAVALDFAKSRDPYKDFQYGDLIVKGFEYSQSKEELLGQTHASIIDVMALFDKEMEKMDIEQRKKDFGL